MEIYDVLRFLLEVVIAAVGAIAVVWKTIQTTVDSKIRVESDERKLADSRIEEKLFANNEKVHVVMGKIELMDQRIQEHERARMQEIYDLKVALRDGLHKVELQLARIKNNIPQEPRDH